MYAKQNKNLNSPELYLYAQIASYGDIPVSLVDIVDDNPGVPELLFDSQLTSLILKGYIDIQIIGGFTYLIRTNVIPMYQKSNFKEAMAFFKSGVQ